MMVPGYWADQGIKGLNGVVWFRKEIDVPANMAGQPAKLFLGRIIDADQAYVNGKLVGGITYQYPPRRYELPAGTVKAGKNIIVVRITNTAGKGGFVPDKNYSLQLGSTRIDLRGEWQYKVGQVYALFRGFGQGGTAPINMQNEPTGLFNPMIAPLINYPLKGMLWYQGEANAGKPDTYQYLLPALIKDWRNKWQQPDVPFIYVQLPNFMEVQYSPSESDWAILRDGQLKTLSVSNTAMAVAIDLGEWNDIHPLNKKEVGERLALAAEKLAYHNENIVFSGPVCKSAQRNGSKVILAFDHTGSGLVAKEDTMLNYFAIAGPDKKYVWAKAIIDGNHVIVWNDDIANPVSIRYAWADNPEGANLYNKEGLPASPFQVMVPAEVK
jgi:sialate O-acetylesterase